MADAPKPLAGPSGPDRFIQRESGGRPFIGTGGTDLSNAPLDKFGFPVWVGIPVTLPDGTQTRSHAAGLYQIQPGTWRRYAKPGESFHNVDDQRAVAHRLYAAEGAKPWAASEPGAGGGGPGTRRAVGRFGGMGPLLPSSSGAGIEDVPTSAASVRRALAPPPPPPAAAPLEVQQAAPAVPSAPVMRPLGLSPVPLPQAPNLSSSYRDALAAILSGQRRPFGAMFG